MNKTEIAHLLNTITSSTKHKDSILQRAFFIYNNNNAKRLDMSCTVCYKKVYEYILSNANI